MKATTLILLFSVCAITGCNSDESDPAPVCGDAPVYLEEDGAIISDPFQVVAARVTDYCLEIEVMAGGCDGKSWEGELFVFPRIGESYPLQVWAEFQLEDRELCEAAIRKSFTFDLSGLRRIDDRVLLNLNGWEEQLLFPTPDPDNLVGKWNLIRISGGLMSGSTNFSKGQITWEFGPDQVKIINQVNQGLTGFESGTYDYLVRESDQFLNYYQLEINDINLGPIVLITDDSLAIDQRASDGAKYLLVK